MTSLRFALLPLALIAVPVLAEAPTSSASPAPKAEAADKKICRSVSATGSYMRKRECHTKAEWAAIKNAESSSTAQTLERRRNSGVESY